jgi:hypothetical protein
VALGQLITNKIGSTPDTARAAYYERSPVAYSAELARVPLILYWATDDEIILNGETHQEPCWRRCFCMPTQLRLKRTSMLVVMVIRSFM